MIVETGTVVALESNALWVETIQKTTCEACVAQKGCGTRVLSKLTGKTNRIRVLATHSCDHLSIGQAVSIGIPEDVIVKGSMLVYILPVICAVAGAWLGGSVSESLSIISALLGLLVGGLIVSRQSKKTRNDLRYQPVLLDGSDAVKHLSLL
jgi:sigma-E factor negative regulatory protein RseC